MSVGAVGGDRAALLAFVVESFEEVTHLIGDLDGVLPLNIFDDVIEAILTEDPGDPVLTAPLPVVEGEDVGCESLDCSNYDPNDPGSNPACHCRANPDDAHCTGGGRGGRDG